MMDHTTSSQQSALNQTSGGNYLVYRFNSEINIKLFPLLHKYITQNVYAFYFIHSSLFFSIMHGNNFAMIYFRCKQEVKTNTNILDFLIVGQNIL